MRTYLRLAKEEGSRCKRSSTEHVSQSEHESMNMVLNSCCAKYLSNRKFEISMVNHALDKGKLALGSRGGKEPQPFRCAAPALLADGDRGGYFAHSTTAEASVVPIPLHGEPFLPMASRNRGSWHLPPCAAYYRNFFGRDTYLLLCSQVFFLLYLRTLTWPHWTGGACFQRFRLHLCLQTCCR